MEKIVVIGGSFNPPTIAHRDLMKAALDALGAYKGIFVPAPYKYVQVKMERQGNKNAVLPGPLRVKMLEAFCSEDGRFAVSDFELGKFPARTFETLTEIQRQYPTAEIYFVVGADKLHILPKWHNIEEFLADFKILAAARGEENPREIIAADKFLTKHSEAFQIFNVPEKLTDISSSKAREYLRNQNPEAKQLFNSEIWKILTEENAQMYFGISRFRDEYDFLSNFYEAPVNYRGITYQNNEAAFQAQKTLDEDKRREFASVRSNKAKKLGRSVSLRADWEDVKEELMYEIVKEKFIQNPDLKQKLLNTDRQLLTEGNTWHDTFWGVDLSTAQGQNHLGKILMRVRDELK
ncbi:MAG: NADAR domain-containing protein [Eubacterium sp.]|nr:NADAR domain-containing protein [Eubacterium sp.]